MFELPSREAWLVQGHLGRVRLPSLLQLVDGEALTGRLAIGGLGSVDTVEGRIVAARCLHLAGPPALRELFLASGVAFGVAEADVAPAPELVPLVAGIVDGTRIVDEWERVRTATVVSEPDAEAPALPGALPSALCSALTGAFTGALAAGLPVWRAALRAGLLPSEVVDPLLHASELGVLRLVDGAGGDGWTWRSHCAALRGGESPTDPAPVPTRAEPPPNLSPTGDPEELLDQGRRLVRAERLDEAIQAFEAVLRVDPRDRVALQNLRRARILAGGGARPGVLR